MWKYQCVLLLRNQIQPGKFGVDVISKWDILRKLCVTWSNIVLLRVYLIKIALSLKIPLIIYSFFSTHRCLRYVWVLVICVCGLMYGVMSEVIYAFPELNSIVFLLIQLLLSNFKFVALTSSSINSEQTNKKQKIHHWVLIYKIVSWWMFLSKHTHIL